MKKITISLLVLVLGVGLLFALQKYFSSQHSSENTEEMFKVSLPVVLAPRPIALLNGKTFTLNVPEGFSISPAAEGLGRARFMAMSPDGRLFVPDMKNLSDNSEGKIYILDDFNPATKKFESKSVYLSNLRNPNSLAFYEDEEGIHWLYIALTDRLIRFRYSLNEIAPTGEAETLATFPDYGLDYKYGGWHLTRTVLIHKDKVYVSVGSSCNACEEKEEVRASVIEMNPDGSNQRIIAKGLRNAVGLISSGDDIYATNMGSDHLGDDKPEDTFYKLSIGANYGWPYCYEYNSKIFTDESQNWNERIDCREVPLSLSSFPAHSAPLGVERLGEGFLAALHGSGVVSLGRGYKIVYIDKEGETHDFLTGFLEGGTRHGRPAGILKESDSSFFFTDDFGGVLYYVYRE